MYAITSQLTSATALRDVATSDCQAWRREEREDSGEQQEDREEGHGSARCVVEAERGAIEMSRPKFLEPAPETAASGLVIVITII